MNREELNASGSDENVQAETRTVENESSKVAYRQFTFADLPLNDEELADWIFGLAGNKEGISSSVVSEGRRAA